MLLIQLTNRVADREGGTDTALGIVLVRDRSSEQRHDGVANEFGDLSAKAFEHGAHPLVEGDQGGADVFGVAPVGPGCRVDQVGEQHGHHLALFTHTTSLDSSAAGRTEPRSRRKLGLACPACFHVGHHRASGRRLHPPQGRVASPFRGEWRRSLPIRMPIRLFVMKRSARCC